MLPRNAERVRTASAKADAARVPTMVGWPSGYELRVENDSRLATLESPSLAQRLNEELYTCKIEPLLAGIANPIIMSALGASVTYAVAIRAGRRRPHPRHWEALAELVGVSHATVAADRWCVGRV